MFDEIGPQVPLPRNVEGRCFMCGYEVPETRAFCTVCKNVLLRASYPEAYAYKQIQNPEAS